MGREIDYFRALRLHVGSSGRFAFYHALATSDTGWPTDRVEAVLCGRHRFLLGQMGCIL